MTIHSSGYADLHFYFDPVCPFAWMTSKWVRMVQAQRDLSVDWRFISLRQINAHIDYDTHFPPEYEAMHDAGLRLLRVASTAREHHGPEVVGPLYEAFGTRIFETPPDENRRPGWEADVRFVTEALAEVNLPASIAEAVDDRARDAEIQTESDEALTLAGKDVGTPILHFQPPAGLAFFGPVISRIPNDRQAVELWDHVTGLARFPGFAELKRSLRERPQLPSFGVPAGNPGAVEDWHAGSRRTQR